MKHLESYKKFEGSTFKDTKKEHPKHDWDPDKISDFRDKLETYVGSQDCKVKKVGSDLEINLLGKHIGQIMFRKDFVSIKKMGEKFPKEFKYTELGKIKSAINNVIKDSKKVEESLFKKKESIFKTKDLRKEVDYDYLVKHKNKVQIYDNNEVFVDNISMNVSKSDIRKFKNYIKMQNDQK